MAITKITLPDFDYLYENFNDDIPQEILPEGSLTYAEVIEQTLTKPEILREKPLPAEWAEYPEWTPLRQRIERFLYFSNLVKAYTQAMRGWEREKRDWDDTNHYVYQNTIWKLTKPHLEYSEDHQMLLVMEEADKERKDFERLKRLYDSDATKEAKHKREPIPEDVRIAAWPRDEGKCVQCDSNERLEYDHIIPVSKGGSNTVRNIQLLCETCNRQKSDSI